MCGALIRALAEVDRPGDVCTSGDLPLTMPGLVVEGLGMLRLPLGESQARELVARCRQAPSYEPVVDKFSSLLVDWRNSPNPQKFAVPSRWYALRQPHLMGEPVTFMSEI